MIHINEAWCQLKCVDCNGHGRYFFGPDGPDDRDMICEYCDGKGIPPIPNYEVGLYAS